MPLFDMKGEALNAVTQVEFSNEKALQNLVEKNLKEIFNFRFVASEFKTGAVHAGRIDTLALSEDGSPVIIEYKKVASSELINQSLYYLSWIKDHHGDFEIAAQKQLGKDVQIDWSDVRVICLAPNYKKYDLHAVQVMGANIELWTYKRFGNGTIYLEEQHKGSANTSLNEVISGKNPVMVEAGKKAAITKANATWTFEQHLEGRSQAIKDLVLAIQEYMTGLDPAIEEDPRKYYVAYRTTQNIVCVEVQKQKILLFLKLDPSKHKGPPGISKDMRETGHFGTGDLQITVKSEDDLAKAKPYMKKAYEYVGS